MPDRVRRDAETRDRVDEIGASMENYRKRLDTRYWKVAAWLTALSVGTIGAVLGGYASLQGQRWEQTRDGCTRTNSTAEATVQLLRDLNVQERVVMVAMVSYPHTPPLAHRDGSALVPGPSRGYEGPMTCEQFADERVGWFRL